MQFGLTRGVVIGLVLCTLLLVLVNLMRVGGAASHNDNVSDRHGDLLVVPVTEAPAPTAPADGNLFAVHGEHAASAATAVQFLCFAAEWPNATEFVDLVALVPVLDAHVHHVTVYACDASILTAAIDDECCARACFFDLAQPCHTIVHLWDKGAEPFHLPPPFGVRVGRRTTTRSHLVVQVHSLDVPSGVPRVVGADFVLAPQLREQEAHWLCFDDTNIRLVPGLANASTGVMLRDGDLCEHLTGADETSIMAVHLHMHSRGRRAFLRRKTRDDVVEELLFDNAYTGYGASQNVHWLDKPIAVRHDDTLILQCVYDTTGDTAPVEFGVTERDEMCAVAILFNGPISDGATNFIRPRFG